MSQQAAIEAERQRRAEQAQATRRLWTERAKTWGVLGLGAAMLIVGMGSWGGAALGADGEVNTIVELTKERRAERDELQTEFDTKWTEVIEGASDVELSRIEADSETISSLTRAVVTDQDPRAVAQGLGIEDTDQFLVEFLPGRQEALDGMRIPSVHEQTTQVHEWGPSRVTYISTAQVVDASKQATGTPEAPEPPLEDSRWIVMIVETGPDGQVEDLRAWWASAPAIRS